LGELTWVPQIPSWIVREWEKRGRGRRAGEGGREEGVEGQGGAEQTVIGDS